MSSGRAAPLPRPLRPGSTVGLLGPSGSSDDPELADKGAAAIESFGFRVVVGDSCRRAYGYLAGPDERRAADLNAFFADDAIDGIVCMKGGYGATRILDKLDYADIARHPKVFAGYSDITALHLALRRYAGFPTFHAPMAVSMTGGFDAFSAASWMAALTTPGPLGLLSPPPGPRPRALSGGTARGPLVGGNLSLVAALIGTPYALVPDGAILFLEDVDEEPYRVDRMLTQLRLAGVFERCSGVVLGHWTRCEPKKPDRSLSLERVFADVILPSGKPTIMGFAAGHSTPTLSFPLGAEAVLDADAGTLEIVGSALADEARPC